jgi:hypothetical protein
MPNWRMRAKRRARNLLYPELHPWMGLRPWKRHGLVLMVAGLIFISIGFVYVISETTPARAQALWLAFKWMPQHAWGVVWMLAGILAIVSSRWPPVSKTWGYMVLTGLSAGWSAFYALSVIFGPSPATNLTNTLSWGLIAFLWWAISGLLNPNDVRLQAGILVNDSDPLDNPR